MAIEVKLPEVGPDIESGDVLDILVAVGDTIKKDQDIIEIETDKATMNVPAPQAGKVTKIHVAVGDTVSVGGVILELEAVGSGGESGKTNGDQTGGAKAEAKSDAGGKDSAGRSPKVEQPKTPAGGSTETSTAEATPPVGSTGSAGKSSGSNGSSHSAPTADEPLYEDASDIPAGPAVRRLAREVGVDLTRVQGSGDGGRIVREDVVAALKGGSSGGVSATAGRPASGGVSTLTMAMPKPPKLELTGDASRDQYGPVRVEKLAKIRKTIAERMHQSWSTVPRVTNFDDADVTELEKIRQVSKNDYASRGIKLTTMPFLIKAVAMALKAHPVMNASIDMEGNRVIYKDYVNVGIAMDTERGLVVPVLKETDRESIPGIAKTLGTLADRVRSNDFKPEELRGGSFTISNLGAIGGAYSTPIVNVPEVAILLVGRSRKMPLVMDNDQIAVRLMMPLSLSYDHRLVDGAAAARFLNDVIGFLESPSRLLLAP